MPITISKEVKNNPVLRWNLDDSVFFAAGACHILAYAFLQMFPGSGFKPLWIKPVNKKGNHIIVSNGKLVFDYRGYTDSSTYYDYLVKDWTSLYPNWSFELVEIPADVLISEEKSKEFNGLWLREPDQFLHNALPRAYNFLKTFDHNKVQ
jgi:hypothetical protein